MLLQFELLLQCLPLALANTQQALLFRRLPPQFGKLLSDIVGQGI
jgi:hypothetical protein